MWGRGGGRTAIPASVHHCEEKKRESQYKRHEGAKKIDEKSKHEPSLPTVNVKLSAVLLIVSWYVYPSELDGLVYCLKILSKGGVFGSESRSGFGDTRDGGGEVYCCSVNGF